MYSNISLFYFLFWSLSFSCTNKKKKKYFFEFLLIVFFLVVRSRLKRMDYRYRPNVWTVVCFQQSNPMFTRNGERIEWGWWPPLLKVLILLMYFYVLWCDKIIQIDLWWNLLDYIFSFSVVFICMLVSVLFF